MLNIFLFVLFLTICLGLKLLHGFNPCYLVPRFQFAVDHVVFQVLIFPVGRNNVGRLTVNKPDDMMTGFVGVTDRQTDKISKLSY